MEYVIYKDLEASEYPFSTRPLPAPCPSFSPFIDHQRPARIDSMLLSRPQARKCAEPLQMLRY